MDKKMSQRITLLGFTMTCIIAMYHLGSPEATITALDSRWNDYIHITVEILADLAMNYFFAVSGYLLFRGLTFQNFGSKLKRRALSLLTPYFLWQILFTLWNAVFGYFWSVKEWLSAVVLTNGNLPDGPLWYLHALFVLALLSPVWLVLFRNRKLAWWSVMGTVILSCLLFHSPYPEIRKWLDFGFVGNVMQRLPAYIVGAFYGYHYRELSGGKSLKYGAWILLLGLLLEPFGLLSLTAAVMQVLPIFALYLLPVGDALRGRKLYRLSFLMYAIHMPMVGILKFKLRWLTGLISPYGAIHNLLGRGSFLLLVIAGAAILHGVLNRFCPRLLKLLTGGRC